MKKRYLVRACAALIFVLCLKGAMTYKGNLDDKVSEQIRVNIAAQQSNELLEALKDNVIVDWEEQFQASSNSLSLDQMSRALDIQSVGLLTPNVMVNDPQITEINYDGTYIGLLKACVKNTPAGFIVGALSIERLLEGLSNLEARNDIEMGPFQYVHKEGTHQVIFERICLLLRAD